MINLAIGESTTDFPPVRACKRWNSSGLLLREGATYEIQVFDVENWRDWCIKADPERGHREEQLLFKLPLVNRLRRFQGAPWYALVGSIGKDRSTFFRILPGRHCTPDRDGQLLTFANDAYGFYWNNRGTLRLAVTRLA